MNINANKQKHFFAKQLNKLIGNSSQIDIANHLGTNQSTFNAWCTGKNMPRMDKVEMIADFFGVSVDYLLGRDSVTTGNHVLTEAEEQDIQKRIADTISDLEQSGTLLFDGEPLDDDTRELLAISLENTLRMAKDKAKKKYTPKKYRKNNTED